MIGILFDGEVARGRKVWLELDRVAACLRVSEGDEALDTWPLKDLRAVGDQAGRDNIVLMHDDFGEARLVVTDEDLIADLSELCPDLYKEARPTGQLRRAMIWAGAAVASVALIVLVIIPGLSDRLAPLIPPAREEALGKHTVDNLRWALGKVGGGDVRFCSNEPGRLALLKMGERLATSDELPYPVKLQVVNHPMINAFAVPGGHIVLFSGLIKMAGSPEEVAAVLAHEMGHVVARDPTRLALRSASSAGILSLLIGDFTGGAAALILTEQLVAASYTRAAETDADSFAHRVFQEADLPLEPMAIFFERMGGKSFIKLDEDADTDVKAEGDTQEKAEKSVGLSSHLRSHPDLQSRAEAARAQDRHAGKDYEPVLTPEEWISLRQICAETLEEPVP